MFDAHEEVKHAVMRDLRTRFRHRVSDYIFDAFADLIADSALRHWRRRPWKRPPWQSGRRVSISKKARIA